MKNYKKVIFVCSDNTCTSIIAEAILNKVKGERELEVISRGMIVLIPEPLNPKAVAILKAWKLEPLKEYSQELAKEDLTPDTLILTMTQEEAVSILERFSDCLTPDITLTTLRNFTGQEGDFPVPIGTITEYGQFYEAMDLSVKMAAQLLFRDEAAEVVSIDMDKEIVAEIVKETTQEFEGTKG